MERNGKEANVLIIALIFLLITAITAGAFLGFISHNSRLSRRINDGERAFYIAEAGLKRALYNLNLDFENDPTDPSWADGDINGISCGPDSSNFYVLPFGATDLDDGSYTVFLKNIAGTGTQIYVRSTGAYGALTRTIEIYARIDDFNIWNNCVFGGAGASGAAINGNVDIRGSVHILGDGLADSDLAMDLSGTAKIGNNYDLIPSELADRIPDCPQVVFNGEVVDSLGAEVRIKNGLLGLSGTGMAGEQDISGNTYKETVDGVYISDGYGGNQGENNVYSDNGTGAGYDLRDKISFPRLSDPYGEYATHQDYLRDNALVISSPGALNDFRNITPGSNFSYSDSKGSISIDGSGNLTVSGIVYLDGGELGMNKAGADDTITYSGSGTIFTTEGAQINVNLLTNGPDSFPTTVLGVMTPGDISFNQAQAKVMGAFYAENSIVSQKQTSVAGTFVSDYFDMGNQVPSIFQVPELLENLPPGMIGTEPIWIIRMFNWKEI